jgi:hypothetical protein
LSELREFFFDQPAFDNVLFWHDGSDSVSKLGGIEMLGVWELRKVMGNLGLTGIELENILQSRARIVVQSQLLDDRIPVQIMQRILVQVKRVLWPWQHDWMSCVSPDYAVHA